MKTTFVLLALILFGGTTGFAQGVLEPQLPDPHKTIEWTFLHLHDTEKPYEGVSQGLGFTSDKETVNMPEFSDMDLYAAKFETYLRDNEQTFEQKKIKRVRFILDSDNNLTREQREMLTAVAKANGYNIKFETMKIDWEGRYRKLVKEGADNIEELIPAYILEKLTKKEKDKEVKRARNLFVSWAEKSKYYEKPTRRDVTVGSIKGVFTLAATGAGWMYAGMGVTDAVFWVLTAEHVLIETFFGPYQRTYMNFLYNKIKPAAGNLGLNLWGQSLGFTMYFVDVALIFSCGFAEFAPWDPVFLSGYFGMTFIGSLLGGFMPVGIYKLIQKGWMTKDASITTMIGLDALMPLEGVLWIAKFPYMAELFAIHQAVKFGIYVAGDHMAKSKNSLIVVPKGIYDSKELQDIFQYNKLPDSKVIKVPEKTREFLESKDIPQDAKMAFAKYIKLLLVNEKELIEYNPEFKRIVTDIVGVLAEYVDRVGAGNQTEIEKLRPYSKTSNIFLNDPEDLKSGYRTGFLGKGFWKNANYIYSNKNESKRLKKEITGAREIVSEFLRMPLSEYKFDFDAQTEATVNRLIMMAALSYDVPIDFKGMLWSDIDIKYDLTQSEDVSFEKWFEKVSTKDKVDNPYEFNKILFDYDLLGWMYRQQDNDKKNSQVEYLLGQVTKYSTAELTPSQKIKYEDWRTSCEAESDYAQQGTANYLQRASEYLGVEYSKLKWNKNVKEEFMDEVLESIIEKYQKLGKEEIRILFVGDAENKPVAEYFLEKAKSGDAYAQYKISILGLVLTHNVSRMKFSYEPLYKDFIDRASMFMLKIENDERIDRLEKTRRDILEGKFRFVK